MPVESLVALLGILTAAIWTPGPNNAMLASSGATFGFRRTLPHAQGVAWGFPLMLFAVAMGLGEVFARYPLLHELLRYLGAALLLWVAWRIATAAPPGSVGRKRRPFTFLQAVSFQWINPKAWVMCIGIAAQFVTGAHALREALICAAVAAAVGLPSASAWTAFGAAIGRWLGTPLKVRVFNAAMAGLIVLGVVWLLAAPGH